MFFENIKYLIIIDLSLNILKRKVKLALDELEKELDVFDSKKALELFGGSNVVGSGSSWDCVFRVLII